MPIQFPRFFSTDNPKAVKAKKLGWLNAINYMAPHRLAGVGDLCGNASKGCIALCLGQHSGNAALYPTVIQSRIRKAKWFMKDQMAQHIAKANVQARKAKLKLCVGSTDLAWEHLAKHVFTVYSDVQFIDYTKSPKRAIAHAKGLLPPNYHLTFSRSETNEADCKAVLAAGGNVSIIFGCPFPKTYLGYPVVDGDQSDLRHLDSKGCIIALTTKGQKAKHDTSGCVVWSCDLTMKEAA